MKNDINGTDIKYTNLTEHKDLESHFRAMYFVSIIR